jgi:hypothetical protein
MSTPAYDIPSPQLGSTFTYDLVNGVYAFLTHTAETGRPHGRQAAALVVFHAGCDGRRGHPLTETVLSRASPALAFALLLWSAQAIHAAPADPLQQPAQASRLASRSPLFAVAAAGSRLVAVGPARAHRVLRRRRPALGAGRGAGQRGPDGRALRHGATRLGRGA